MKNKKLSENYLKRIPVKSEKLGWKKDENGIVTLEIENTGVFNRIFQKLLKKPKISYIHLDETGSFIWPLIDGKKNIIVRSLPHFRKAFLWGEWRKLSGSWTHFIAFFELVLYNVNIDFDFGGYYVVLP